MVVTSTFLLNFFDVLVVQLGASWGAGHQWVVGAEASVSWLDWGFGGAFGSIDG
jgi:hypothetical protein